MQTPVSLFTSAPSISDQLSIVPAAPAVLPLSSVQAVEKIVPVVEGKGVGFSSASKVELPVEVGASSALASLAERAATCRLCALSEARTQVVFGAGNPNADLVFIGEAPGHDEDLKGEPFVGQAGQLLDRMLTAMGMDRDQVYMMNTIKCRPPNNRDPRPDEVQACNLWFEQQLDLLRPKMICLLGRVAAQTVLGSDAPLGSLRGRWHDYRGVPVWVTYHPAFLLRSPAQKQKGWQDLQELLAEYRSLND